ncbi:MAG: ABC transporter permease [Porticoccaceae bacterium]
MQLTDQIWFNGRVIWRQKVRTILLLLAVSIGVASVVMLTSLGEGARRYINDEFSSLGNRLLIVFPGRNETVGGQPTIYGTSPRDLTLEDALAMGRVPSINAVAPILAGTTPVSRESLSREVVVLGTTASFFPVRQVDVAKGNPLPDRAVKEALSVVVLGSDLKKELFGNNNAIGQWVRIADRRVRVIGVLADEGESMGVDMADIAIIPVPLAQQLFNTQALFRVILELQEGADEQLARRRLEQVIRNRHDGEDDITIVSQDSVLAAFNNILTALTLVIAAIAAISLIVAGILVMNISLISVRQRRQEIGLLKAIGGSGRQIRQLFLGESLLLVFLGSMVGVVFAYGAVYLARFLLPDFPLFPPYWAAPVATLTAMLSGLIFCWLPARKAAQLDPIAGYEG